MTRIKNLLKKICADENSKKNTILVICSLFLATATFFYFFPTKIKFTINHPVFIFVFFIFFIINIGTLIFRQKIISLDIIKKFLLVFLPSQIILLYALQNISNYNSIAGIIGALYFLIFALYIITKDLKSEKVAKNNIFKKKCFDFYWLIVFLTLISSFTFGTYGIGKMAIVDESLWTFDRIPNFWRDTMEKDWAGARVSDKPGLTTAIISGIGLLFEQNPKQFKNIQWHREIYNANANKMELFNVKFRLPLLIFFVLMLPFFYWLLKIIFGKIPALFSVIFIGLSPILIGNARIINPDGILWIFTSLSIFGYFAHLKEKNKKFLYFSALMLGLGILTKYTANILYIFFFIMIFAEYIFNYKKYASLKFSDYLKISLLDYTKLTLISLAVFYVFYPAVWEKPDRLLIGTIYSQAFAPIWPFFTSLIVITILDMFALKGTIISFMINKISVMRKWIFAGIITVFLITTLAVFINTYLGMKFYDFELILSSPKSAYSLFGPIAIFLVNFYPLLFGISALAFIFAIIFLARIIFRRNFENERNIYILYFVFFIILYYLGSVFSHVASIIRYQIILFPIILTISGVALGIFLEKYSEKIKITILLIIVSGLSLILFKTHPFYMGYASELLPKKYSIDTKGMGEGSYEVAQYLNSLGNASELVIWSDKQGVCVFFVGRCYSTLSRNFFEQNKIDYFIASSDRASRTTKMIGVKMADLIDFNALYLNKDIAEKTFNINGRSSNFMKIVRGEIIKKQ